MRGYSFQQLGITLAATGRAQESVAAGRQSVEILEKLVDDFPDVPYYRVRLNACRRALAGQLEQAGGEKKPETSGVKTEDHAQPAIAPKPEQSEKQ